MKDIYNKLEHLENLIIAMNQNDMKRIRLPIPKEYGGGYATGDSLESAVQNLIKRLEQRKTDQSPIFSDYYYDWIDFNQIGNVNWDSVEYLKQRGWKVYAGERDSFGWLTGIIEPIEITREVLGLTDKTKKYIMVFG